MGVGGGLYDSGGPVLITYSLAFPHIDLVRLYVHMLLGMVTTQLFLSLSLYLLYIIEADLP